MTRLCSLPIAVFSVRLENGPDAEPSFTHFLHILPHFQSDPISSLQEAPPHWPTHVKVLTGLAETPDRTKGCHFVFTHCNQHEDRSLASLSHAHEIKMPITHNASRAHTPSAWSCFCTEIAMLVPQPASASSTCCCNYIL